jgi:hypothetical protein
MNVRSTLEAHAQPAKRMHPGVSSLDHPAHLAEAAAVRFAAPCDSGRDIGGMEDATVFVVIVAAISVDAFWCAQRSATHASYGRNGFDQRNELGDVVAISAGQDDRDRRAVRVGGEVVLGAWARAIGGVRSCFWPAPTARIDEESTMTREKSMRPAARSSASSSSCSLSQMPACCQSRRRRQQLTPEPQPISSGRSFQRMPVRRTKTMPVSAARSETGRRPGYRKRLGFAGGSKGSISFHSSSSMIGFPISSFQSLRPTRLTGLAQS